MQSLTSIIRTAPPTIRELSPFLKLCPVGSPEIHLDWDKPVNTFVQMVKSHLNLDNEEEDKPREVIILTHGFQASTDLSHIQIIKNALLSLEDRSRLLIMLDWGVAAGNQWIAPINSGIWAFKLNPISYFNVVPTVKLISKWVSPYIASLKRELGDKISIYGIGHSLGAHLVGLIAKDCERRHGIHQVFDRITGLDPAAPAIVRKQWNLNKVFNVPPLSPSDAKNSVDVIHTSGGLGTQKPLGSVDFYPNFGRTQPGCFRLSNSSHMRVLDLFAWSITNPNRFMTNMTFDTLELRNNDKEPRISKTQDFVEMGFHCKPNSTGIFYIKTGSQAPWDEC